MNAREAGAGEGRRQAGPAWRQWLGRAAKLAFFALVAWLLLTQARDIDWQRVLAGLQQRRPASLWLAGALAAASFGLYSCFDLLGRHYTRHGLGVGRTMAVNFISYVFNLNLGSLVGGVGFRFRLYAGLGLDTARIAQITALSMLTNWIGYLLLAGVAFVLWPLRLPPQWHVGPAALRVIGGLLLGVVCAYVALCAFSRRRQWRLRGVELRLPSQRLAGLQLLMSCANWMLIAAIIHALFDGALDYPTVLAVLLVAAIAGVITHVPAGLGVLEAVFIGLLAPPLAKADVLATLIAYRAIYYLAPLALATVLYLLMEAGSARRRGSR
ncbi:hypothetical protein SAMN06265795_11937 [Noviherbaspirillum humi]|uniref:Lysylphosphatidylglycerol synthase TM region n=1 Tax=Noviherbaspirillum humi TaxID=1688639 RepID=A0A239L480_9BURK|nr:lysylphosphatidylglycerol synthase domain-containing protein [Noviherbaspirillum humi]SNT25110.1 hypothetical protein SAMN06265795_11937 [Noviherbaspirillum humi]